MSDDLKDAALRAVQRKTKTTTTEVSSDKSRFYKDYYSLETGKPIDFQALSTRIKKRFADIDRSSALAMIDLWFLHAQWGTFYSRTDSFSKYIKEELLISKTTAYAILNSVDLLNQYFIYKGNTDSEIGAFINQISESIESVGIKKLTILSKKPEAEEKFSYLERLLDGEHISADALSRKTEKKVKPQTQVTREGKDLMVDGCVILSFTSEDERLRRVVTRAVEKWYLKSMKKEDA